MSETGQHAPIASAPPPRWSRLLADGGINQLPPLEVVDIGDLPPSFSPCERAAVAVALSTPDICLINGPSAEARERVAGEIAARATRRGERTLVVHTSSADAQRCAAGERCPACTAALGESPPSWVPWWSRWIRRLFGHSPKPASPCPKHTAAAQPWDLPSGTFDLLIVVHAEHATESELASASTRARRWVLIGGTGPPSDDPGSTPFQSLWRQLCFEPWTYEGERLVCLLRRAPSYRRAELEIESVADRPEIELRILPEPTGVPQLAEVVFPARMQIAEAKAYVWEQLGEAPLCGSLNGGRWIESADSISIEIDMPHNSAPMLMPLANGVWELVGQIDSRWTTHAVRFARSAGWDRASAQKWLATHGERYDSRRTVRLH
jgi:hypothetical protein